MILIIILHAVICIFLVAIILIQPGKADGGLSFGSSSQSIFGSKGAGNFLTKTTAVSAVIFLLTSFALTKMELKKSQSKVTESLKTEPESKSSTPPPPLSTDSKTNNIKEKPEPKTLKKEPKSNKKNSQTKHP